MTTNKAGFCAHCGEYIRKKVIFDQHGKSLGFMGSVNHKRLEFHYRCAAALAGKYLEGLEEQEATEELRRKNEH
jgi:hypothetical protein